MKTITYFALMAVLGSILMLACVQPHASSPSNQPPDTKEVMDPPSIDKLKTKADIEKGLKWLAKAQAQNGGWGAGLSSAQNVRDPHAVQTDPATTAISLMALLRSGNSLDSGPYQEQVRKGLDFLLIAVEAAPENSNNVIQPRSTQPQRKLGQNIDASMSSQFFGRILNYMEEGTEQYLRIEQANIKCLDMIRRAQNADGSMQGGTWAGVLQDAMANTAIEDGFEKGYYTDTLTYRKARETQAGNINANGQMVSGKAAGIEMYAFSATTRSTAKQTRKAKNLIKDAWDRGDIGGDFESADEVPINVDNLLDAGVKLEDAENMTVEYEANQAAAKRMTEENVLRGFGNNGGEEFLSNLMTSESMVLAGGEGWETWNNRMQDLLPKIQNPNGSWSGHHCITSPVFCTAACILTLTVPVDESLLAVD